MNYPACFTAKTAAVAAVLGATLAAAFVPQSIARTLKPPLAAPAGWTDRNAGQTRILTRDGLSIEIGGWQSANGQTVKQWLKSQERKIAAPARYVSTNTIQAERAVEGSYSLLRTLNINGENQTSVLYACPGKNNQVRLMELRGLVTRQTARLFQEAAQFGEQVCRSDPNRSGASARTARTRQASVPQQGRGAAANLASANAQIPARSRPVAARIVLEDSWVGFPAVLVSKAKPQMTFANGYSTTCAKWNPLTQSPTPGSAGRLKRCTVAKGAGSGKAVRKFAPGETIDINFGRITGSSSDYGSGSSSSLAGGTLIMTKDGRIEIGKFNAFSASGSGSRAGGGNRKVSVRGRYYLNGHTITIQADNGRIYHGFIAGSSNKGSRRYDNIFINGEHYWNRKK